MTEFIDIRQSLLEAIMPHVVFDGWSPSAFDAAVTDAGIERAVAEAACPRGAVDLAVAAHKAGDAALAEAFAAQDLTGLRYSQKVARAIELRLDLAGGKDTVRRATTLFALPHMAVEGAALIWATSDTIWNVLGDTSEDVNWYTKRTTLSAVYASVVLFWLGDEDDSQTRAFIERRIGNVMQFEKLKSDFRASKTFGPVANALARATKGVRAPGKAHKSDLPGFVSGVE